MTKRELNVPVLEDLASWLEQPTPDSPKYDLATWGRTRPVRISERGTDCGTVVCMGGYLMLTFGTPGERQSMLRGRVPHETLQRAAEIAGLSETAAARLFLPEAEMRRGKPYAAPPAAAAKVIRHLIKTKRVAWHKAFEEEPE